MAGPQRLRLRSTTLGPRVLGAGSAVALLLALPASAAAHQLSGTYQSRLPLAVYLAGAAIAVALSFAFVLARDVRAADVRDDGRRRSLPGPLAVLIRAVGLVGWAWIIVQGILGGSSSAEVGHLFLWVYGWVGLAMFSAFIGPLWHWLDPFTTLHDLGAWLLRTAGIEGIVPSDYPAPAGRWPGVVGFAVVVWLELVLGGGDAFTLFAVFLGYTVYTLVMMALFGRDTWRANGETFSVWFGLLGRIAPWALDDPSGPDEDGEWVEAEVRLRRRGFGAGLLEPGWQLADVVLVGLGTGSILFDGLSQTQIWFDIFGAPGTLGQTGLLLGFLAIIVAAALLAVSAVGIPAAGAALLPIAVGYLVAHYLTYLLIDGQRIVIALADPFQQGWALLPTAFWEPTGAWLPPGLVWTIQLAAVVGGHMLGAWGGHVVASRGAAGREAPAELEGNVQSRMRPGLTGRAQLPDPRLREIPLAVVMVGLTTLTLWSLGQALVQTAPG